MVRCFSNAISFDTFLVNNDSPCKFTNVGIDNVIKEITAVDCDV